MSLTSRVVSYFRMLEERNLGKNSWAICWHASCFLANMVTLYPKRSLVKNMGLDNSGENCGPSEIMEVENNTEKIKVEKIDTAVNSKYLKFTVITLNQILSLEPGEQV